jgi:hydrogenase maturation protein HypF
MRAPLSSPAESRRWGVRVRGTVQGIGFRPAVYRLASALALGGSVRNDSSGVWIEIEGDAASLEQLVRSLAQIPRACIDAVEIAELVPAGDQGFFIVDSVSAGTAAARIPCDLAPCDACLAELFDRADRRFRYPFINCTGCGPRYTIVLDLPYDRSRTSMRRFPMCRACEAEYHDPGSRRFHAEPNACRACGPQLALGRQRGEAALAAAVANLDSGKILALKGVGGFLLAADARNGNAVARLRERKRRPHQPFALMARDLEVVEEIAILDDVARRLLKDPARPIVLVPARQPGLLRDVGVMLPSTPLHELLLHDGPPLLIMTSGNRRNEPLARDDAEAAQLGEIADAVLTHDRAIVSRIDDSVVRIVAGGTQPVRRARGLVPDPIELPFTAPPILAVGAELKATVSLTRGAEVFVSPHLGDLSHPSTRALFDETILQLARFLDVEPAFVAHDLHRDYASTRWARSCGLPTVPVQHHHAHVAACLAEHGRAGPALGVAFDGTGCGPDGDLWGGEILHFDLQDFRRLCRLRPLPLPGGEAAIREPWRMAVAALADAGVSWRGLERIAPVRRAAVERLAASGLSPRTSSCGRWFDAVAALLNVRDEITYEGQAAIELEALTRSLDAEPYPFTLSDEIDLRPMVRDLVADLDHLDSVKIAARFHVTLAHAVAAVCRRERVRTVALSGGCFQNRLLSEACIAALHGFEVLIHRRVPPNDGGVSLGQAAVAACRLSQGDERCVSAFPAR